MSSRTAQTARMVLASRLMADHANLPALLLVPAHMSPSLWLTTHLTSLLAHVSTLLNRLLPECPCPQMRVAPGGDKGYLCAVHSVPRACAAVDHISHTLDGFAAWLLQPDRQDMT
jgi:hypothetical protein